MALGDWDFDLQVVKSKCWRAYTWWKCCKSVLRLHFHREWEDQAAWERHPHRYWQSGMEEVAEFKFYQVLLHIAALQQHLGFRRLRCSQRFKEIPSVDINQCFSSSLPQLSLFCTICLREEIIVQQHYFFTHLCRSVTVCVYSRTTFQGALHLPLYCVRLSGSPCTSRITFYEW